MSLFGAMTTAIGGLNAQSAAFGNIGDDVANSQTIGYKRVDTRFEDFLTTSTPTANEPGAVEARPQYANTVQGTVTQTDNPLALAISGQGFFTVVPSVSYANGSPVLQNQPEYTRAGDFSLDKDGLLVNGGGQYLAGWAADATGKLDTSRTVPLQVSQAGFNPVPTGTAALAANLPASSDGSSISTEVPVIDALGRQQVLNLTWAPVAGSASTWTVSVAQAGAATPIGSATVAFGAAGNAAAPEGTVGSVTAASGSVTGSAYVAGGKATLGFSVDFGAGPQPITLALGHWGQTDGLTQFAGSQYTLRSLQQDGVPPGAYTGVAMNANGDLVASYDNGQSRVLGRVPVTTFANPDALQRQNGQAFTATLESGAPQTTQAGTEGAGTLVASATESSNVDIATEFSKLIVAQRAYAANTKMVTTADDMLQATLNMKQ